MRSLAFIPLALLLAGCWTPGPGERDPTLYPWDPSNRAVEAAPAPHPVIQAQGALPYLQFAPPPPPSTGSYCIISLEPGRANGITIGGGALPTSACAVPVPAQPSPSPSPSH
jgi:hypothetical protein